MYTTKQNVVNNVPLSDAIEEACRNVANFYNRGNNCDKSVFLALQGLALLPKEIWDFTDLYSEKPDDTEQFLCKVLAAGVVAIYLDIISRRLEVLGRVNTQGPGPIERVNALINAILSETAAGRHDRLDVFDPFESDRFLEKEMITGQMRSEYRQRVDRLTSGFHRAFNCRDCVDILGFDPFSYELYDEQTQEQIESGEWMAKCVDCMKHIIRGFIDGKGASFTASVG